MFFFLTDVLKEGDGEERAHKLGPQCRLSDPTREQSQQNPGGPPLQNDRACYTPLAYKL